MKVSSQKRGVGGSQVCGAHLRTPIFPGIIEKIRMKPNFATEIR